MLVSYKAIGRNIRAARSQAGLTQEQVSERLRISQLHFGRLERGERPVSLEMLAQIASALQVPLFSLLKGCVMERMEEPCAGEQERAVGIAVSQMAEGCSPQARKLMLELCRAVAHSDKHPYEE